MKIIAVHKSSDTIPFLICVCKSFEICETTNNLTIHLDNAPYRTDDSAKSDSIYISEENYDWVDEWPMNEASVKDIQKLISDT